MNPSASSAATSVTSGYDATASTDVMSHRISPATVVLCLGLVLGLAIRVAVVLNSVEVADVQRMHEVGTVVLRGENPYLRPDFYNYPPLWMYVEAGSVRLSQAINVPFQVVIKTWSVVADLAIGVLLYLVARQQGRSRLRAALWTWAYLLNPVSIVVTAAHGQFDSIPGFLSLLALALLVAKPSPRFPVSALALGLAFAIKPNPVLLLPFYAATQGLRLPQRVGYVTLACVPVALTFIPFVGASTNAMIRGVFGYSGVYDFGYAAVMRGAWMLKTGSYWLPGTVGQDFDQATKYSFGVLYVLLFVLFANRGGLAKTSTATYLLFLTAFTGISAQYYAWVLPFAVLAEDGMLFVYTVGASAAMVGFYLVFWPAILLGRWNMLDGIQRQFAPLYLSGNLLCWIVCAVWLVVLVVRLAKSSYGSKVQANERAQASPLQIAIDRNRLRLAAVLCPAAIVAWVPAIRLIAFMVKALTT